jgi:hypothetical protein
MPLKVSDGIGAWIKDFKKSDAPQFKGKSEKERRDQAIAAYLSAKRGPQNDKTESWETTGRTPDGMYKIQRDPVTGIKRKVPAGVKNPTVKHRYEEIIRSKKSSAKLKRDASSRATGSQEQNEDFNFKVDIEGLPSLFMTGNSPGSVKAHLRKLVKQPSMVKDVQRVTRHDKKKELRKKSMEEEVPHDRDEGKSGARKHAAKMTPGQQNEDINKMSDARLKYHVATGMQHGKYTNKEIGAEHKRRKRTVPNYDSVKPQLENRRDRLRAKLAAVGKDMEKTNKELKKTVGIKDKPVSRSSTGDPNYKSPFFKSEQQAPKKGAQPKKQSFMQRLKTGGIGAAIMGTGSKKGSIANKIGMY